jgi:hypothetical protein
MIRYTSYQDFSNKNIKNLEQVIKAKTKLKSIGELSVGGQALSDAETLAFDFLNLKNIVTDLMFGLSASVLDAKAKIKEVEGTIFRELDGQSAAAREKQIQADARYVQAHQTYNDLFDLQTYLENKAKDFETTYYYYRGLSNK